MSNYMVVDRQGYGGLFMVALATLMYEILLTRIFSVTMYYHFGFMAISIAMFGITVGATLVYVYPDYFKKERTKYHLALSTLLFSWCVILSFLTQLVVPFVEPSIENYSLPVLWNWFIIYFAISVPFIFSGIAVCLAFTRFPHQLSQLYASDLAGAGIACILLMLSLEITDGPTTVIIVAFFAGLGAVFFSMSDTADNLKRIALISAIGMGVFAVGHGMLVNYGFPAPLRILWVKGQLEKSGLFEKWNSFSRIKVFGDPETPSRGFGWGISRAYSQDRLVKQLWLNIDANAATVMTKFDGDLDRLDYMKYDITNLAHWIKQNGDVLVVGSGGGRDILAALAFNQLSVTGVEMNKDIVRTANGRFGDFTGHLDKHPKVKIVVDEGRSYISRLQSEYDIIQIPMIDTWAATAAGAFVLSEHTLYTVEAWELFLRHLKPEGVFTVTRGLEPDKFRLMSLAAAALRRLGAPNPEKNIVLCDLGPFSTILVSRSPFSDTSLITLENICSKMQFRIVYSPRGAVDVVFRDIASGNHLEELLANFPINIAPPTDDNPFFFHMLRLTDIFRSQWVKQRFSMDWNTTAVTVLGTLIIIVVSCSALFIIFPLFLKSRARLNRRVAPFVCFFASIGMGFMLVEISQMQRFNIFLGHPTYSLSVVLFTLLISCGLGSWLTRKLDVNGSLRPSLKVLLLLIFVLVIFGILTPYAISASRSAPTPQRILTVVGILFPLGIFMGMAFPLGMRAAASRFPDATPWFWGVNGATSVCGSVFSVAIALFSSITVAFWVGVACYAIGFLSLAAVGPVTGKHSVAESVAPTLTGQGILGEK